jgi:hypothetical protein
MVEVIISGRDEKMRNKTSKGNPQHICLLVTVIVLLLDEWFVPREAAQGIRAGSLN